MAKDKKEEATTVVTIKLEWLMIAILLIALPASIFTQGFRQLPFNLKLPFTGAVKGKAVMNPEEVKSMLTAYINDEILQGQQEAEITEIVEDSESSDLYKIKISIAGQEYESFVSKDGKYLYIERQEIVTPEEKLASFPKQDTPEVLLFTMSYCPYGNVAEDFVQPVDALLGNYANIEPHYVIYDKSMGYEGSEYCLDEENKYCSMHGIQELNQGVRELCVHKYQEDKFWDFVFAANEKCDSSNVDQCWEQIASEVGIDIDQVKSCQTNEAIALLAEEVALNEKYGVRGSPTIIINGQEYDGNRTPNELKKAVCASFTQEPGECSQELSESTDTTPSGSCN